MKEALQMYEQMTFEDILNATSSQESEGGALPYSLQGGQKIDLYGQEAARVNHTQQQENNKEIKMRETYGQNFSDSLNSSNLSSCLGSRLKTRLDMVGSIEYIQTWKEKRTPSGRLYLVHTVSERHTGDTDSIGEVSAWPKTPLAGDAEGGQMEIRTETSGKYKLRDWVVLAAWPTASSRDWKDSPGMKETAKNPNGTKRVRLDQLPRVAHQVFLHGITSNSSSVGMEKLVGYRLNPYFSAWLMGFPKEWTEAGLRAFRKLKASRSRHKRKVE